MSSLSRASVALFCLFFTVGLFAQTVQSTATTITAVPHVVRISSSFHPANGSAASVESATLAIYAEENEGSPLWQETQNVPIDTDGHYTVLLGSTLNEGLPLELFLSGEPRWLGVQFHRAGEVEQSRILLASRSVCIEGCGCRYFGRPSGFGSCTRINDN